jgi:histidine ammonia-lyase
LQAGLLAGALSLEAYRANLSPLDPELSRLRGLEGHAAGVNAMRGALEGSSLFEPGAAPRLQDPISFRSLAPVLGCALQACEAAAAVVTAELNGVGDSPVVLPERDAMLSSVNFDTTELALSMEAAGLALSHVAALSAARVTKLMSPGASGLPRFLTRHGGSHSGFATTQKTASALEAEIRHLANCMGALTLPVADGVEEYAPMTPRIVEKTHAAVRRFARLAAIELVVAAQAADLREPAALGRGAALAYGFVRADVAPLDDDRPMGREYETLALRILDGGLPWRLGAAEPAA